MSRDPELKKSRDEVIRAEYERLRTQRNEHGELMLHPECIIGRLSRSHYLTKRTIENILYTR